MKFYYLEDDDRLNIQMFTTKKAAMDWVENDNVWDDYGNENIFTKEDIQILYVPHPTKKSILNAFSDISGIVGNSLDTPELYK
tara:strand:+ start:843 stop:1091 length:249 start_codon:yes stop_codon:yes gene_type:complete